MNDNIIEYNFVDIIFIFFGIYDELSKLGTHPIDNDEEEPESVKLYGSVLSGFIMDSSMHSFKYSANLAIIWTSVKATPPENNTKSILHKLIYDIGKGRVDTSKCYELNIVQVEQLELYEWCKGNNFNPPSYLIPGYDKTVSENSNNINSKQSNNKAKTLTEQRIDFFNAEMEELEKTAEIKGIPFNKKNLPCNRKMLLNWIKGKTGTLFNGISQSTFNDFFTTNIQNYTCTQGNIEKDFIIKIQS